MTYKVVISSQRGIVVDISREYSYSSGEPTDCIEEKVSGELERDVEYEVEVFLYAGESGNTLGAGESGNFSNKTSFSKSCPCVYPFS